MEQMTYAEFREVAQTGDVLLVRGSLLVRIFSAESISHVALVVWMPNGGLWVFEFVEGVGYQGLPASEWFERRKDQTILHGVAPKSVRIYAFKIVEFVTSYRNKNSWKKKYGWGTLLVVWLSQITGRKYNTLMEVCSTFVQEAWEHAKYMGFTKVADPGEFLLHCSSYKPVRWEET